MNWIKKKIINWAINQIIATKVEGMSEEQQWRILSKLNSMEEFDHLLKSLISADILKYFEIPELDKERQSRNKGSVIRLKWFRREMQQADDKLKQLTESKKNDNSQEHF